MGRILYYLFAILVGAALIGFGTSLSTRPAGAQERLAQYKPGFGLMPICRTSAQILQVAALRNKGQSWDEAVAAVNSGQSGPRCIIGRVAFVAGGSTARLIIDGMLFEIREVDVIAVFLQNSWRAQNGRGFAAIQMPSFDI